MASPPSVAVRETRVAPRTPPTKQRSVVVFHLGGQAYALPLQEVQEIVPMALLSRPPGMPSLLAGFLNLGGTVVPVVRLDRLFVLADQPVGLYTPLLILRSSTARVALMVEKVSEIMTLRDGDLLPVRENHSFNDCVEGMVTRNGRVVLLLDPERILLDKEHQFLAELQDREQARLRAWEGSGP